MNTANCSFINISRLILQVKDQMNRRRQVGSIHFVLLKQREEEWINQNFNDFTQQKAFSVCVLWFFISISIQGWRTEQNFPDGGASDGNLAQELEAIRFIERSIHRVQTVLELLVRK